MSAYFKLHCWIASIFCLYSTCCIPLAECGCYRTKQCCPGRNMSCFDYRNARDQHNRPSFPNRPEQVPVHPHAPGEKNEWHIHTENMPDGFDFTDFYNALSKQHQPDQLEQHSKSSNLTLMHRRIDEADDDFENSLFSDLFGEEGSGTSSTTTAETSAELFLANKNKTKFAYDKRRKIWERSAGRLPGEGSLKTKRQLVSTIPVVLSEDSQFEVEDNVAVDVPGLAAPAIYGNTLPLVDSSKVYDVCYCDEVCQTLSDCCDDYEQMCPTADCQVSEWTAWSECQTHDAEQQRLGVADAHCGAGIQTRTRQVLLAAQHGGHVCPELQEKRRCYHSAYPCQASFDEVARLLPFRFAEARIPRRNSTLYFDHPREIAKWQASESWCVLFQQNYLSPSCTHSEIVDYLRPQQPAQVCVECQPTAQQTRSGRCYGEGVQAARTQWTPVVEQHCFGFWTQQQLEKPCRCQQQFPHLPSYVFV